MNRTLVRMRDDRGMSVAEVVIAAAIMFFVLTAMLGLIGASTTMSSSAKQRQAVTNIVASRLDWVRSLPFDQVGLVGSGNGKIPVSEGPMPAGDGSYTVTLNYTVRTLPDGTKDVTITGVCKGPGVRPMTFSRTIGITDWARTVTQGDGQSSSSELKVRLIDVAHGGFTPLEKSVLYGPWVWGGQDPVPLKIQAKATAPTGATIVWLKYTFVAADGTVGPLRSGPDANAAYAQWGSDENPLGEAVVSQIFSWNTLQTSPAICDGWVEVIASAKDSLGNISEHRMKFEIDNVAPLPPGAPWADVRTDRTQVTWSQPTGEVPASYEYLFLKEPNSGPVMDPAAWTPVWGAPRSTPSVSVNFANDASTVYAPYSRYVAWVRSVSPVLRRSTETWMQQPFVTRPTLTGTSVLALTQDGTKLRRYSVTTNLSFSKPSFPATWSYKLQYRPKGSTGAFTDCTDATVVSTSGDFIVLRRVREEVSKKDTGQWTVIPSYEYRVTTSYTATGYQPQSDTLTTNICGPEPDNTLAVGTYTLQQRWE